MTALGEALRQKFKSPHEAMRALGLDSKLLIEENLMSTKPTRFAAITLGLVAANVAPLLAMDSKIELPKSLFSSLTTKNFQSKKAELLAGVRKSLDGKLRRGVALDASMEHVGKVMDTVSSLLEPEKSADESVSEPQHNAMEAAAHGESNLGIPKSVGQEFAQADKGKTFDAEPLKAFLKEKGMGEDDINAACDMLPKAMDETDEEKQAREAEEKGAADKKLADDKAAKDKKMADDKKAMDGAIDAAVKAERKNQQAIRSALDEVRPFVGELAMAMDSADDVYRKAAEMLGIEGAKDIHASALPTLIRLKPKAGARPSEHIAMDSATVDNFSKRFPNASRITTI